MPGKDKRSIVNQEHTKEEPEVIEERYEDRVKDAILGVAEEDEEAEKKYDEEEGKDE